MQSTNTDELLSEGVDPGSTGPGTIESIVLASPVNWFEKYLLVLVIGGLVAGIWVASFSQTLVDYVDSTVNLFMNGYGYVAPVAIFLILTPSLARLFAAQHMGWFGLFVLGWFAGRKILAGLWAVAFVFLVFRIPFLPQGSLSLADGIMQTHLGPWKRLAISGPRLPRQQARQFDSLLPPDLVMSHVPRF